MCHEYADLRYLKREAEERTKRAVRETTPAPAPAAEPAGGLVAVLRGLVRRYGPRRPRSPPSKATLRRYRAPSCGATRTGTCRISRGLWPP